MARGITEDEVWKACDALLLEGARPTIERVRQKLGRGSPNTVSPMLETWFKTLGNRIADPGAFSAPPDIPDPVLQAAKHFWEAALAQTRQDFDQRLQERMNIAVENVEAEKERAEIASRAAFDATSRLTRLQAQSEELQAKLEAERLKHAQVAALAQSSEQRCSELQRELTQAREEANAQRARADAISEAADVRAAGAERRAVLEIERERSLRIKQEKATEAMAKRVEEAIKLQAGLSKQLEATEEKLASALAEARQREQGARTAAELQEVRVAELQQALASAAQSVLPPNLQAALVTDIVAQLSARGAAALPKARAQRKPKVVDKT
jgi:Plasmid replication region DNA-binding N-term